MTKLELNKKLADLYGLEAMSYFQRAILLIDDWNMLMPLALNHKIGFAAMNNIFLAGRDGVEIKESYNDHESPEDAAKYAIALALVKLAESK